MAEIKNSTSSKSFKYQEYILKVLRENINQFVSGEILSKSLGITRAYVCKQIKSMALEGYKIECRTKLGYRLIGVPDLIIPYEIEKSLDTQYIGKKVYYYKLTGSTNEIAFDLAKNSAPNGTVVIAEVQNKGKGRHGRSWISPHGGLWFTLILRPKFPPDQASKVTIVTSISIIEAISELYKKEVLIKWPNDLFAGGKKMGGILIEMSAEIDRVNFLIVGIGINVNNKMPASINNMSVSLKEIVGEKIDRNDLLKAILSKIEKNMDILEDKTFIYFLNKAKELCLTIGKKIKVEIGNDSYIGICKDLDENGNLVLQENNGNIRTIVSGDITLLRQQ